MNERILSWCHYCGRDSAFEIKGNCAKKLSLEDKEFPTLLFIERDHPYEDFYLYEGEVLVHPSELKSHHNREYTLQKEWIFMQCVVCLQPILIEKENLETKYFYNDYFDMDEDPVDYDPDPEPIREFKPRTYTHYPLIKIEQTPNPHEKMPTEIASIFTEARKVFSSFPRASAALLRLALESFFKLLNFSGKDINDTLKKLEQRNFLTARTIQACDSIRILGNNSVHLGEINLNEDPETAKNLFLLLNYIVEDITNAKTVDKMFEGLPDGAKKAIRERQNPKNK